MLEVLPLIIGVVLAQIAPGPNLMAVASASLGSGRRAGIATALGVSIGVFIWAVLFTFGIGALLQAFPETLIAMRLLGGGYLVFLGIIALRSAFTRSDLKQAGKARQLTPLRAVLRGGLVVLTNPKAMMMWVAVSMFVAPLGYSSEQFLQLGCVVALSALFIYSAYGMLFSTGWVARGYARFFKVTEGAFGVVFGAIGGKLIWDGIREFRA